jgi:dTDP-4-amino-4,6-dideoxygalactose transaminase
MYHHEEVGYNSRLDALQAAVLAAKLPHLAGWSAARRAHAAYYDQALAGIDGLVTPPVRPGNETIVNQYTLRVTGGKRDALREYLTAHGVGCSVYYPVPLHLQECFAYLGYKEGEFPESERACREVLSIPVYPELTQDQTAYVAETIRAFFGGAGS